MTSVRLSLAVVAVALVTQAGCRPAATPAAASTRTIAASTARVPAGGVLPPVNALDSPRPKASSADAGAALFSSMNCDGCHGGGAVGWVGPSLVDGRWRYGGSDEDIFTSIVYGRPKGMPAYGGVIGSDGVWNLVAYIKSQGTPSVVPTTSWLPGGNASPNPSAAPAAAATPPAPAPRFSLEEMPAAYGCTGCHAVDHKVVGPAFADVARKYSGKDVEATLVAKVRRGGSGNWGEVPMPPNPGVPDENLHAIVRWILTLK